MIVAGSTIKDTLDNIQLYVEGNLSGGVDHLVIFLDEPSDEIEAWLVPQPFVTCVVTDESWWGEFRPVNLNRRQFLNMATLKGLLMLIEDVTWLFHIDGDEILRLDRDVLAGIPGEHVGVSLEVYEAVAAGEADAESGEAASSREKLRDPRWFKRPASDEDVKPLFDRGALEAPRRDAYFRGHWLKSGIRPGADVWISQHWPVDRELQRISGSHGDPGLRLLHLDTTSFEQFVRRWQTMLGSSPDLARLYPADSPRGRTLAAVVEIAQGPVGEREERMRDLYRATVLDDLPALRELGYAVEIDPRHGGQQPDPVSAELGDWLAAALEAIRPFPKAVFLPQAPPEALGAALDAVLTATA